MFYIKMSHVILLLPICLSNLTSDRHLLYEALPATRHPRSQAEMVNNCIPPVWQYFSKVYSVLGSVIDAKDTAAKKQEM